MSDFTKFCRKTEVDPDNLESFNEIYKDLGEVIGMEATYEIYKNFRGIQISFPVKLYKTEYLHSMILSEYNGKNVKQLAKKYGYSEKSVRRIISNEGEKRNL